MATPRPRGIREILVADFPVDGLAECAAALYESQAAAASSADRTAAVLSRLDWSQQFRNGRRSTPEYWNCGTSVAGSGRFETEAVCSHGYVDRGYLQVGQRRVGRVCPWCTQIRNPHPRGGIAIHVASGVVGFALGRLARGPQVQPGNSSSRNDQLGSSMPRAKRLRWSITHAPSLSPSGVV